MSVSLHLKLLCPEDIGIAEAEALYVYSYSSQDVCGERPFIHPVAVAEGIAVEKDVANHCMAVDGEKKMEAEPSAKRQGGIVITKDSIAFTARP